MIYSDWQSIVRIVAVGTLAYAVLLVVLRATGKRTLSKMNAFDLVVTVAIGSTFATTITAESVPAFNGIAAMALLVLLQFAVTWLSVRVPLVSRLVKASPAMLFYRGNFLHGAMRRERVTEGEILAAIRAQGFLLTDDVEAVVLETAGELSVLRKSDSGSTGDVLGRVTGAPEWRR